MTTTKSQEYHFHRGQIYTSCMKHTQCQISGVYFDNVRSTITHDKLLGE